MKRKELSAITWGSVERGILRKLLWINDLKGRTWDAGRRNDEGMAAKHCV